jgi:peroxiredoxin (alkyl hydroperoxide reductase subunit C)
VNAALHKFKELGIEVLVISCDTKFSHKRFVETEPLLEGLELLMGADTTGKVATDYGVYLEEEGIAIRGRFLVNPDGIVVAQEVLSPSVGRNVNEFIRQVEAYLYAERTGEVCPANWKKSKKTLPVNTDLEKMTGRVGDYITLNEILS